MLGIFAFALAIGFSAFTKINVHHPKKGFTGYVFVHTAHSTSDLATDWTYVASPTGCANSSNYCKATFDETSQPSAGANPTDITTESGRILGNY